MSKKQFDGLTTPMDNYIHQYDFKICVLFADGFDITQIRYKWIDVSLYSTDMAEFYIMNQTLSSDKVKYMIGQCNGFFSFD